MAKEFTWICGADVLVDDVYSTWEVKASTIDEAWCKAMEHINNSNVLDSGTLEMHMDAKELAIELGNMAAEDDSEWEPVMLTEELCKACKIMPELYSTLESIVCKGE